MFKKALFLASIFAYTHATDSVKDECMKQYNSYCPKAKAAFDLINHALWCSGNTKT